MSNAQKTPQSALFVNSGICQRILQSELESTENFEKSSIAFNLRNGSRVRPTFKLIEAPWGFKTLRADQNQTLQNKT